jgi:hypothetical protein
MENPLNVHNPEPTLPLEKELLPLFTEKAPFQIPDEWQEVMVKYGPYILLILVPLSLLAIGIGAIATIFSAFTLNFLGSISLLLTILSMILNLVALPGLFSRSRSSGWTLLYYGFLLNTLASLVTLSIVGILSGAIGFLIGGFILFQIRGKYK